MRKTLTLFATIITLTSFGQSAQDFLESGIEKENQQKHKEAIKDFTNAIKKDPNLADAFFARGTVKMNTSDFPGALEDFNEAIRINPKQISAIYNRAGIYANTEKFDKALLDLNSVINIDEKFPSALTLRGQIKSVLNDNDGSCKDFQRAKEIGDKSANSYISKYCNKKDAKEEFLNLKWPKNENWKEQTPQENDKMKFVELLRNNETFENWTEIGTCTAYKNSINVPCNVVMNMTFENLKKKSPKAKLTVIEKDEKAEFPWILFTIECPNFIDDNKPESQLWYIIQGKTSLYTNFRAVKKATIPSELKEKWIPFFKSGKMIYQ